MATTDDATDTEVTDGESDENHPSFESLAPEAALEMNSSADDL